MISHLTYPPTLNPARNPISVVLSTDNMVTTTAIIAELKFGFIGGAAIGNTLKFEWVDNSLTFTFVASPDNSGLQLTAYPGSGTFIAWAQTVIADLNRNYALTRDFNVTYAGAFGASPTISLLARFPGPDFDVTVPLAPAFYIFRARTNGVSEVVRDRFRILCDIQMEGSYLGDDWMTLVTVDPTPDADGEVSLDLAEICRGKLTADLPVFNQTIAIAALNMRRRFRLRYCESFNDPVETMAVTASTPFHAILAGIDPTKWPGYDFPQREKFLSWWPAGREKSATELQQEYLYFLLDDPSVTVLYLEAVCTWTDGTTTTATVATTGPLINYDIFIFPAGAAQLALATLEPTKTLEAYTLQLSDGVDPKSEIRLYRMDYHVWPTVRHLLFRNSLGGLETLLLTGYGEREIGVDRQITQRILPAGYQSTDAEYSSSLLRGEARTTARTGFASADIAAYWTDVVLKGEAWEIREDRFVPVIVTNTKLKVADDLQDVWSMEIEYYQAYNSHSFTP